ncbi:hypothetical protein K470DRAFT_261046 [Piedraia hortae CBS 480.64]|uniref:Sodium/calcium exchanger membrane region domain-containing protein n=1 Tax=Piedraia hortae CBS 480.64 TaxID=1314780 RepID=A0A6A7BPH6_9PEZI|nr:hypothetical protein K470DRAFT_261046 [Piedraia hortae CBS 480.64]
MRPRYRAARAFFLGFVLLTLITAYSLFQDRYTSEQTLLRRAVGEDPKTADQICRKVHRVSDRCKWVKTHCLDDDPGYLAYLEVFFCGSKHMKPLILILLASWLCLLFSAIGIAASDFFCINLNTIALILGMGESVAGVTLLAFGNGSPDLFSTFAAMNTGSGSLALGELFGAAGFISAVVTGSMALIKPFQVSRKSFVRDVCFFIVAAAFSLFFLWDGKLHMWECLAMVASYVVYVLIVVVWHWWVGRRRGRREREAAARAYYVPTDDVEDEYHDDPEDNPRPEMVRGVSRESFSHLEADDDDDEARERLMGELSSNMRVAQPYRHRGRKNTLRSVRPSLVGALEFQSVLNNLQKSRSLQTIPLNARRFSDDPTFTAAQQRQVNGSSHGTISPVDVHPGPRVEPPRLNHSKSVNNAEDLRVKPQTSGSSSLVDIQEDSAEDEQQLNAPPLPAFEQDSPLPQLVIPQEPSRQQSVRGSRSPSLLSPFPPYFDDILSPFHEEEADETAPAKTFKYWPAWLPSVGILMSTLFPTFYHWKSKNWWERCLGIVAAPSIFLLTITLPVVESGNSDETENTPKLTVTDPLEQTETYEPDQAPAVEAVGDGGNPPTSEASLWNRWLLLVQIYLSPLFVLVSITYQSSSSLPNVKPVLITLGVSTALAALVALTTSASRPPPYRSFLSLFGFVVSITWISLIASQVVGALKALAVILNMSEAIMGLTIFAVGNSLSDLVADITVARLGFPVMALSACFGGPMLNILLGIGLSGTWVLAKRHAGGHKTVHIQVSTTLLISGATLLLTLVGLLVIVPLNKWTLSRRVGALLVAIWLASTIANVVLESVNVQL